MPPPLIVLDTQVVISALIGQEDAASHRICKAVGTAEVLLAISDAFLIELSHVIGYPDVETRIASHARTFRVALDIGVMGTKYRPRRYDWPSLVDPKDGWMLDLAWEARADYIITRDGHLRTELPFPIEVLTPPQLLSLLSS